MATWMYLLHAPREDFVTTMTDKEQNIMGIHFLHLRKKFLEGEILLVGPCLEGKYGLCIFDAENETTASEFMNADPAIAMGLMTGELHPYKVSLLRKSEEVDVGKK